MITSLKKYPELFLRNKLLSNASIYVIGNLLQKALGFFLIPLYARFLTPADYGIAGIAVSFGNVVTIALALGIPGSIARLYYDHRDREDALKQFISSNFLFITIFLAVVISLLSFFGEFLWANILGSKIPFSPYIRIVLWTSFADILIQIPMALFRSQQKSKHFIIAQIFNFLLSAAMAIIFVGVLKQGAKGQLLGSFIGSAVTAIIFVGSMLREWGVLVFKPSLVLESLRFGLPLVPHSLSGWIMSYADRLLLETRVPLEEIGFYNLGYQIGMGMAVLVTGINLAYSPYYYELLKNKPDPSKTLTKINNLYIALMGGVCLFLILFSQEIIRLAAPAIYQKAAIYTPLILFSYLFNGYYYMLSMPLFYYKKTHIIPIITVSSAVLNILLNIWWIPLMGPRGSAWATLIVYILSAVIAYYLGRRLQPLKIDFFKAIVANLLIFLATIYTSYDIHILGLNNLFLKFTLLFVFVLFVFISFIRPILPVGAARPKDE